MTAFCLLAALGTVWAAAGLARQDQAATIPPLGADLRQAFDLVDTAGHAVTAASYGGRWMLLYFGYAFSPDTGPSTLQSIATALDDLGPDADKIVPLFVTIDPARDTRAALAQYVRMFDERLVGLTGSLPEVEKAEKAFGTWPVRMIARHNDSYSFEPTSSIYLLNPDGKLSQVFPAGTSAEVLELSMASRLARGTKKG